MISGTSSRSNNSSLPVIEQAETSSKQPGITLSDNKNTFSLSRLCSSQAPLSSQLNHSDPIIVKQYNGLGIFDHHVFSKPFATRYYNAKNAIESSNNKEHIAKTGEFSPEAKKAVTKFISIVYGKNADTSTAAKTRQVFLDGPLTDIEKKHGMILFPNYPKRILLKLFLPIPGGPLMRMKYAMH